MTDHRIAATTTWGPDVPCPHCDDRPLIPAPYWTKHLTRHHPEAPMPEPTPAELAAAVSSCPGYETSPNPCRCPCYGCKHHCSAHNPDDVDAPCKTCGQPWRKDHHCAAVPPPSDVRELVAAALYEWGCQPHLWADAHPDDRLAYGADADAVLRVPAIAEALTAAAEVQRLEAERDEWETTAYRHAKLWRDEQDTSRCLLEQRQEMAAERYAWQERGDKAEAQLTETRNALAMQKGISADLRVESKARGDKLARVRAECDRIEAAVRANPQDPDFDGAYLAAIGHIRRALDPQEQL